MRRSAVTGPFVDDPNQRQFPTYGDASTRRDDALSRDHLYARFDNGRNSAMWGEFAAQTGSSAQGASSVGSICWFRARKVDVGTGNVKLSAFDAKNDVAYARQVYAPTGLSTIGQLLHPDIVVGSDVLTLAAIDRHSSAIKTQTVLTRKVDYTLDYSTGLLTFANIPLPFDDAFDPQQILVQYEYAGTGSGTQPVGGWIAMREKLRFAGRILPVTISRRANQWYASWSFVRTTPASASILALRLLQRCVHRRARARRSMPQNRYGGISRNSNDFPARSHARRSGRIIVPKRKPSLHDYTNASRIFALTRCTSSRRVCCPIEQS